MDNFCKYLLKLIITKVLFQNFPLRNVKHKENVFINVNNGLYEGDGSYSFFLQVGGILHLFLSLRSYGHNNRGRGVRFLSLNYIFHTSLLKNLNQFFSDCKLHNNNGKVINYVSKFILSHY
jgi:hypothetical protein